MNNENLSQLFAVCPIDGRYHEKTKELGKYFSEGALIRYRCIVEVKYFLALCDEIPLLKEAVSTNQREKLLQKVENLSPNEIATIKTIEATTNHDVKAVEYFVKELFDNEGLGAYKEFVHFGLTSQDINNTAFPLMLKEAINKVYMPLLSELLEKLDSLAETWKDIPMLARTHGQPASPTRLGKEINVFSYRVKEQVKLLNTIPYSAKFGGATGNFNAHHVAYRNIDWKKFSNNFIDSLGLSREQLTTQISNYDNLAALLENLSRINTILIDLARDIWMYISQGYFRQKIKTGEVGSSAMPHKVNPIDFENAEGNLMMANAIALFLSQKLPISRLQRDLTDSTVIRNEGMPLAYGIIAFKSLLKGLDKLILDKEKIHFDLENNFEVIAEAIQTILRREGYENPYEKLKAFSRTGHSIDADSMKDFVETLDVDDSVKEELLAITPHNYLGIV